jgi:hypothetical protein
MRSSDTGKAPAMTFSHCLHDVNALQQMNMRGYSYSHQQSGSALIANVRITSK